MKRAAFKTVGIVILLAVAAISIYSAIHMFPVAGDIIGELQKQNNPLNGLVVVGLALSLATCLLTAFGSCWFVFMMLYHDRTMGEQLSEVLSSGADM